MSDSIWAGTVGPSFYYCPFCCAYWNNVTDYDEHMKKHPGEGCKDGKA